MSEAQFTIGLMALIALGVSIVVSVFTVRRLYRCPRCNSIPMASWAMLGPTSYGAKRGVDLNPGFCPNCGARLRSDT
jgi:ribosomal protein S27AE